MNYKLIRTDKANEELLDIASYIADESGDIETALSIVDRLETSMNKLSDMPYMGSIPRDRTIGEQGCRVLIVDTYLIFYTCDDDKKEVIVVAVVYSRHNYTNLIF